MIVYHGSTVIVEKPEIRSGEAFLDFGVGFYTTTSYDQARRWAQIKLRRLGLDRGYVSVYDFDYESAKASLDSYRFERADEEWLAFVAGNRRGEALSKAADLHIGPVADDYVYRTIRLFETGVLDAGETVRRLKTEVLQDQWAFRSERGLACLRFTGADVIQGEE